MGSGLIADFARQQGAQALVKGVRNSSDLNYEMPMATFNRHLSGVETVFLPADARYQHVSSTLVKEIVGHKGDITEFIPYAVAQRFGLR
jgi:pantetheine-phosphate adenylyltransferase